MTIYKCKFCGQPTDIDPADQEMPVDYCSHDVLEIEGENELCEDEDEAEFDPCHNCEYSDCEDCSFCPTDAPPEPEPEPLEKKTYPSLARTASKALMDAARAVQCLREYVSEKQPDLTHVEDLTMMRLKAFQRHAQDFSFLLRAYALTMEDDSNGLDSNGLGI